MFSLASIRKHAGMTQQQLAKRIHMHQSAVSHIENQDNWTTATLARYFAGLGAETMLVVSLPGKTFALHLTKDAEQ